VSAFICNTDKLKIFSFIFKYTEEVCNRESATQSISESTFSHLYLLLLNCPAFKLILFCNHIITEGCTEGKELQIRAVTLLFLCGISECIEVLDTGCLL
jgi:hypothetical protein